MMVAKTPPIRYLTAGDIKVLSRDELIEMIEVRPEEVTIPDTPFFVRVDCPDGVACDCGKCPRHSGSAFVPCESQEQAELRQKLIWNYLAVRRVRARQHEADAMLRELLLDE